MLRCHQQNKAWILRTYISRLIQAGGNDEGLLEDAMAIIGFNRAQGDDWIINCHFNQWASNNLPDPFKSFDEYRITELDRIFARLGLFIEDYMSKATSSNPVLRYLSLPSIVYTDTDTDNRVTLDDLTPTERYRLFRAFLRYEMLCKVFDPKVKDAVGADYQWIGGSYHQTWYGNNEQSPGLERYWRIAHDSWETLDPWLYESLHCVWDYIQACYGAVLAHVAWADKYPAFLTEGVRKKNLLFPDNMPLWCTHKPTHEPILNEYGAGGTGDYLSVTYDQLRIFRQRAWIFYDDTRLFPSVAVHFPDIVTLEQHRDGRMGHGASDYNTRHRRRSPEWQDYWTGRTLESPSLFDEEIDEVEFPWNDHSRIPTFYSRPQGQELTTFWRWE
ncbi:hypothetical protein ACHAP8_010690 [Fusarium lateritium]